MDTQPALAISKSAPRSACPHGKTPGLEACVECWASMLQGSDRSAKLPRGFKCADGKVPCEHFTEKRRCKICKGSWICTHGLNKVYCASCDGRRLCQSCFKVSLPRCYETCKRCREEATSLAALNGMPAPDFSKAAARERKRARV